MKTRRQEYGRKNIERLRKERDIEQKDFIAKMQVMGCDINPTSYPKSEVQIRTATDKRFSLDQKFSMFQWKRFLKKTTK